MLCKGSGNKPIIVKDTGAAICPVCFEPTSQGKVYPHEEQSDLRFKCIICFAGSKKKPCITHNGEHHMLPYPFTCVICSKGVKVTDINVGGLCLDTFGGVHILPVGGVVSNITSTVRVQLIPNRTPIKQKGRGKCKCGKWLKWNDGTTLCKGCLTVK